MTTSEKNLGILQKTIPGRIIGTSLIMGGEEKQEVILRRGHWWIEGKRELFGTKETPHWGQFWPKQVFTKVP